MTNEDEIQHLSALDGIRARPAMYIGDVSAKGAANTLLYEALCLSLEAVEDGTASQIDIRLNNNGSVTIEDDGPGIPVDPTQDGKSILERLFTEIHACRHHKQSGHEHFCQAGIACTTALSSTLSVENFREGQHCDIQFAYGHTVKPLTKIGATSSAGLKITFQPDRDIFPQPEIDRDQLFRSGL